MNPNLLSLSEHFLSLQGEGATQGVPAVFLRFKGCNLTCGGQNTVKTKALDSGATWRCDSIEVWLKGESHSPEALLSLCEKEKYIKALKNGAHLILTGGEPLLYQEGLTTFLRLLKIEVPELFVEVETNGTVIPSKEFDHFILQYNVSFKLKNSGMGKEKRVVREACDFFSKSNKTFLKFVVTKASDIEEIKSSYIQPYNFKKSIIYLMPGCETRVQLIKLSETIASLAIKEGFRYSSRLQLLIWDQKTGV